VQVIHLPTGYTIILDCFAWAFLQTSIAYFCVRMPVSRLDPNGWLFRTRRWEKGGDLYMRLFRVRKWKSRLPSGGIVFKNGFSMKQVASRQEDYLERWLRETCRAELMHWIALAVSGLFFLWNPPLLGSLMVIYAVIANLPCLVTQRYNRPRILRILHESDTSKT